jgi:hypothetical protein
MSGPSIVAVIQTRDVDACSARMLRRGGLRKSGGAAGVLPENHIRA